MMSLANILVICETEHHFEHGTELYKQMKLFGGFQTTIYEGFISTNEKYALKE